MNNSIRVCVPVHGEKFEQMYELCKKVSNRFVPEAEIFPHRYSPAPRFYYPAHAGDWAKAEATSLYTKDGPIFVMDVDAVLVQSPKWEFENTNAVFSITANEGYPLVLPQDAPLRVIQDAAVHAGLLKPGETADVNPQWFWAMGNLFTLYQEMDTAFVQYVSEQADNRVVYMRSLAVWTMVWLKLKQEGKIELFPPPNPVWHCPMLDAVTGKDRLSIYQIFTDYMMEQPLDSPSYPPGSLFGV